MNNKKRIIVSVTNDLFTDQRVNKVCVFLAEQNLDVLLIGRCLKNSLPFNPKNYTIKRFKLLFNKGVLFYAEYNFRLFFFLLFHRFDALLSNDLDTLPANFLANIFKQKKLYYDSHEIYTEVPELMGSPVKKRIWEIVERMIVPKIEHKYTVNNSIATYFENKYKTKFHVIKNLPNALPICVKKRSELNLPENATVIILQGAGININRGAEEIVKTLPLLDNCVLLIVGSGDVIGVLKRMTVDLNITDKVIFKDKMPYQQMMEYTACADIGISLDKPIGLNYKYSLPNKIFDYIQAQIPVLGSELPEIKNIFSAFTVGEITDSWHPKDLAQKINELIKNKANNKYKEGLILAKQEYVWAKQLPVLKKIYSDLIN